MGLLVNGVWQDRWYDTAASGGRFERTSSHFRNWVTADGAAGPSGEGGFRAQSGRYHLYVSRACPWAHRTTLLRALKGLEDLVSLSVVHWLMGDSGWTFDPGPGVIPDSIGDSRYLYEVYLRADRGFSGRVTVPVLWDRQRATIVSNESADIMRMFNGAFDAVGATAGDYYPGELRPEIDALNAHIYDTVNNGVYKAGFATSQPAYEEAVGPLFATLDELEHRLSNRHFLCGDRVTEADWRLWTTLLRFDLVYHGHFKCNVRRLIDYPNLWSYMLELYQWPGVAATVDIGHIKRHYYMSHPTINPTRIVPLGPRVDFAARPGPRASAQ